jgi:hypothetical protein
MNCLQKSNYKTEEENDQAWFIYNIRFAADCELIARAIECLLTMRKGVYMARITHRRSVGHVWWKALARTSTPLSLLP